MTQSPPFAEAVPGAGNPCRGETGHPILSPPSSMLLLLQSTDVCTFENADWEQVGRL